MCELCNEETSEAARQGHAYRALQLERMASIERQISNRKILPHSQQMRDSTALAHALLRYLAEDWL